MRKTAYFFLLAVYLMLVACGKPFAPDFPFEYKIEENGYTLYVTQSETTPAAHYVFRLYRGSQEVAPPLEYTFPTDQQADLLYRLEQKPDEIEKYNQFTVSPKTADIISGSWRMHLNFEQQSVNCYQQFSLEEFSESCTSSDGKYTVGTYPTLREPYYIVLRNNDIGTLSCLAEDTSNIYLFFGKGDLLMCVTYQTIYAINCESGQRTEHPFATANISDEEIHYIAAAYDDTLERYLLLYRADVSEFLTLAVYNSDGLLVESRQTDMREPEARPFFYYHWPLMQAHNGTAIISWEQPMNKQIQYQ